MKTLTREQIIEVFGLDNPWTLKDVLNKLIEASEILLHKKNYDRHGWEEISHCVKRGKEIVLILASELSDSEPGEAEQIIKGLSGEKIEDVKTVTSTDYPAEVRTAEEMIIPDIDISCPNCKRNDITTEMEFCSVNYACPKCNTILRNVGVTISQFQQPEIIAKSGRKYRSIPDDIDIDEWDGMTINERLRYKGLIQQPITDEMTAKIFLQTKGIFSLDTKKRTKEVYEWMEEYASKRIKWALSLKAQPSDELNDIIECVCKFDDKESIENKARYFDVIQRDLRNLIPSKK